MIPANTAARISDGANRRATRATSTVTISSSPKKKRRAVRSPFEVPCQPRGAATPLTASAVLSFAPAISHLRFEGVADAARRKTQPSAIRVSFTFAGPSESELRSRPFIHGTTCASRLEASL
jgi:hypothetical protein